MTTASLAVFPPAQVQRLTGATKRQLQHWRSRGLFQPAIQVRVGRREVPLMAFQDVFEARMAAELRHRGASLQEVVRVLTHLRQLGYPRPFLEVPMRVVGRHIEFTEAGMTRSGHRPEQGLLEPIVPAVAWDDLEAKVLELRRERRRVGVIERRRGVRGYQPVLAGTRVPTAAVWRLHSRGFNAHGIRDEFPDLELADVEAAIAYEKERRTRRAS